MKVTSHKGCRGQAVWVEIGHMAMILAVGSMAWLLSAAGAYHGSVISFELYKKAHTLTIWAFCVLTISSYAVLTSAFLQSDYSVQYVWAHSHDALPWYYKLTAAWGGHEGSWLLWLGILSAYLVGHQSSQQRNPQQLIYESPLIAILVLGLGGFMLATSNPFLRYLPIPPHNGQDLNPLLQDIGFIMHPPCLYLGYVSLFMPFIICMRVLLQEGLPVDNRWMDEVRAWALWGWSWLTLGITLGSWWAYRELGWGGFWFWDPVENASLMPWLVLTAMVHQTASRNIAGKINLLFLGVTGFITTLLGTFLVRSGIVVSVHAFAVDPSRGQVILLMLTLVTGWAYGTWSRKAWQWYDRGQQEKPEEKTNWITIQTGSMLAILLVVVVATLYPLAVELIWGNKISIGPGYYEQALAPLVWLLFYAMGTEQMERAEHHKEKDKWFYGLIAAATTALLCWMFTRQFQKNAEFFSMITIFFAVWAGVGLCTVNKQRLTGKHAAHAIIIIILASVVISKSYEASQIFSIDSGEAVTFRNHSWRLDSVWQDKQENYLRQRTKIIKHGSNSVSLLWPELRFYPSQNNTQTKAYIEREWLGDWYVAIAKPQEGGAFLLRIYYKPFLTLLWVCGGMLFYCGIRCWLQQIRINKRIDRGTSIE